mgnify:CR=1 FL=1
MNSNSPEHYSQTAQGQSSTPAADTGSSPPLSSYGVPPHDPDEINLLEYAYVLVHHKWWIVGAVLVGLVGGYLAALIKGPSWVSEAVIAPRETESQKTPSFSGFGALGGVVASQLNMGGNASLEKIERILNTRKFNSDLVFKNDMLPDYYRVANPEVYEEMYDSVSGKWDEEFEIKDSLAIGGGVRGFLEKETEGNAMTLTVSSVDSAFSEELLSTCLTHLNNYIKTSVQTEAKDNVAYLEAQLLGISDPLLREKLQGLIANEVEKMMVVSKEAFQIVDPVFLSKKFREKKLYPLVFAFGFCFLVVLGLIFGHALTSSDKTDEDRKLIDAIRVELFSLPRARRE